MSARLVPSQVPTLQHPQVAGVFVTNAAMAHPKLRVLPIGLRNPVQWGACLQGQEAHAETRTDWLFCDCLSSSTERTREDKIRALQRNGFRCRSSCRMEQAEYCAGMLRTRFVASPRGNGQHNHREIEAWTAGAIPILDYDANDDGVYAELPHIVVRSERLCS